MNYGGKMAPLTVEPAEQVHIPLKNNIQRYTVIFGVSSLLLCAGVYIGRTFPHLHHGFRLFKDANGTVVLETAQGVPVYVQDEPVELHLNRIMGRSEAVNAVFVKSNSLATAKKVR